MLFFLASAVPRQGQSRFSHVPKNLCFPKLPFTTHTRIISRIVGGLDIEAAAGFSTGGLNEKPGPSDHEVKLTFERRVYLISSMK